MEIRTEQRNEMPAQVEYIGLDIWHLRWNIRPVTEVVEGIERTHYEYNEVSLDHEPSAEEINEIIK